MTAKRFSKLLITLDACQEARDWAEGKTWEEVYTTCHRGDWLMWLFNKTKGAQRLEQLVSGHIANTVRHLMTDERSTKFVDMKIAYGEGRMSQEEWDAARAAAGDAAGDAARAAAWDAAGDAARAAAHLHHAEIVRKYISIEKFNIQ